MVKLNKIYTRTGDGGETGLADGSRIRKDDPLSIAIGDVDEANSAIGVAIERLKLDDLAEQLRRVQNDLFDLGADIATPGEDFEPGATSLRIVQSQVDRLEAQIDDLNAHLQPLRSFILPGGGGGSAELHLARSIVRRAERSAVAASAARPMNPLALIYLNRLSDFLFVAARHVATTQGGDILWRPAATRT